jgi:hypothetical protein
MISSEAAAHDSLGRSPISANFEGSMKNSISAPKGQ